MLAGRMRYAVTILRRADVPGNPGGVARGDFADAFTTRASFKQASGVKALEAGLVEDQSRGLLRVYDCAQNRTITVADRIGLESAEWSIETVSLPDKVRRHIEITVARKIGG
jgi:head-tail adaptor